MLTVDCISAYCIVLELPLVLVKVSTLVAILIEFIFLVARNLGGGGVEGAVDETALNVDTLVETGPFHGSDVDSCQLLVIYIRVHFQECKADHSHRVCLALGSHVYLGFCF